MASALRSLAEGVGDDAEAGGVNRDVTARFDWMESRCASADSYVRAMVEEWRRIVVVRLRGRRGGGKGLSKHVIDKR